MKKMTFGEIIKKSREHKKLSQEVMAKNIKEKYNVRISTSYLSMIETNTRTNLTVNLINAILNHLDLPCEVALSLFSGCQQKTLCELPTDVNNALREAQNSYIAQKEVEFGGGLPPEAQKPLDELYTLLAAKYAKK